MSAQQHLGTPIATRRPSAEAETVADGVRVAEGVDCAELGVIGANLAFGKPAGAPLSSVTDPEGSSELAPVANEPSGARARLLGQNRVTRNLASLVLSWVAAWAVTALMLALVPHFLTATDFGVLRFGATFVSFFTLVGALGTSTYLVKTVARNSAVLGLYVFNALIMKLVIAVLLSAAAILLAHAFGYSGETILIIEIACIGMVLALLNDVLTSGLQGIERMGRPAAWGVVQGYAACAAGLALLAVRCGLGAFAFATTVVAVIPVIANFAHLRRSLRGSFHIDLKIWWTIAAGGFPFLLGASVLVLSGTIDIPILQVMAGSATVGWYALAYVWVGLPAGFSSLVITASLPALSTSAHASPGEFAELANRAIRLVMFVGLPASAGIALVAPDIFSLFHYQAGFQNAIPVIWILAVSIPIIGMDMVLGTALIASDKQRQWTVVGCTAAIFNPLLNLVAIPLTIHAFHNGAIGAALVTVATEGLMMAGAIRLKPPGVLGRLTTSYIFKCVIASLVMVGAVIAAGGAPLALKIIIGVLVYALTALTLGTLRMRAPVHAAPGGYLGPPPGQRYLGPTKPSANSTP
jgi:O-antigen/teichoic acid export membrane protein